MRANMVDVKIANKDQALGSMPVGTGIIHIPNPTSRGTKKRHNCVMVLSFKI
jgi:hypothetical protein